MIMIEDIHFRTGLVQLVVLDVGKQDYHKGTGTLTVQFVGIEIHGLDAIGSTNRGTFCSYFISVVDPLPSVQLQGAPIPFCEVF